MGIVEKTYNEKEGCYEIRFNNRMLFTIVNNENLKALGESLIGLSEAGDYATMILG